MDFMPYADKRNHAEAVRRYRERLGDDPAFLEKEAERKARWYAENRARKNENQRRWRQERREQLLKDLTKNETSDE